MTKKKVKVEPVKSGWDIPSESTVLKGIRIKVLPRYGCNMRQILLNGSSRNDPPAMMTRRKDDE